MNRQIGLNGFKLFYCLQFSYLKLNWHSASSTCNEPLCFAVPWEFLLEKKSILTTNASGKERFQPIKQV